MPVWLGIFAQRVQRSSATVVGSEKQAIEI
jgi:hypothetical protein